MKVQCFSGNDVQETATFLLLDQRLYPRHINHPSPPQNSAMFCVMDGNRIEAHAAALINPVLPDGLLGWFESDNNPEAATMLFDAVQAYFLEKGFSSMIGPMNGSTWEPYRVALPEGSPFFLDVESMPYYSNLFESNGFETIAEYHSTRSVLSNKSFLRLEQMIPFFQAQGITVQNFDHNNTESLLYEIYELSIDSFQNNFLYSPVPFDFFLQKYLPILSKIPSQCVWLARNAAGHLIAFLFAVPNILCQDRRELILKTIAVHQENRKQGLGTFLVELCNRWAFESGFQTVCHALIYNANPSAKIERNNMNICRRYRLYRRIHS